MVLFNRIKELILSSVQEEGYTKVDESAVYLSENPSCKLVLNIPESVILAMIPYGEDYTYSKQIVGNKITIYPYLNRDSPFLLKLYSNSQTYDIQSSYAGAGSMLISGINEFYASLNCTPVDHMGDPLDENGLSIYYGGSFREVNIYYEPTE